jgi:uncharacterized protein (TIGR04255 family)
VSEPLPEFEAPPLVEVVLGIQFNPVPAIRPIELSSLREKWRSTYPLVQEQPPLPAQVEAMQPGMPTFQVTLGGPQPRLWFMTGDETELVQIQNDRLIVNWRETPDRRVYPRFPRVRERLEQRAHDVQDFVGAPLGITQVEVTYINAIEPGDDLGSVEHVLQNWQPLEDHHLGRPAQARVALVFDVPDIGRPPVRMYVACDPGQRPDGAHAFFLTLTIRGAPAEESLEGAMRFMDEAHEHAVLSFTELTPTAMHDVWRRTK